MYEESLTMRPSPPLPTAMDISDPSPPKKNTKNVNPLDHPKTLREMGCILENFPNNEVQSESPTTSEIQNYVSIHKFHDDFYSNENNCGRMINNGVNITYGRDRYTTPITIEFYQKCDQHSIIFAKLHRDVYAKMLLVDPVTKIITNEGKVFIHPKEFPVGKEYTQSFTVATEANTKFDTVKVYVCFNNESVIQHTNFMCNNDGGKQILPLLRKNM